MYMYLYIITLPHSPIPTDVTFRHRREGDVLKEENRSLRQEQSSLTRENTGLKREAEKLERRMDNLSKLEEECSYLQEANKTLQEETGLIQAQFESILAEKEDLESMNREAIQALNEERDAKTALETRMKEASIHNHDHPSLEKELTPPASSELVQPKSPSPSDTLFLRTGSPGSGYKVHSTPYSPKKAPSLLSELQSSFMANVDMSEFEALQKRCKEAEDSITTLQKEKLTLQEKVTSLSLSKTEANTMIEQVREDYSKRKMERARELERLKEEMLIKEEMIGQLRNNLNSASAERASSEIEIDGLKDEIQRLKKSTSAEMDKLQQECIQEQTRNVELKSEISVAQDQLAAHIRMIAKLEGIIYNSHNELTAVTDDLQNLHRTVTRLSGEGKGASSNRNSITDVDDMSKEGGSENSDDTGSTIFNLEIKNRKTSVPVHSESLSLQSINLLRDQLRSVRTPLELFTKTMLEKSLARSVKHVASDPNSPTTSVASEGRKSLDFEASVAKWRTKLAHKTEEVNNLRAIMKARATTAEVAISSLRSKLEGQSRTYQVELSRLKHQIKLLKKEKDEHLSLRTMYAKRCEDYVDDITKMKRELQKMKLDNDELMLSLKKTIQRKLELSTELEEYRMEQERLHLIPKQLNSTII